MKYVIAIDELEARIRELEIENASGSIGEFLADHLKTVPRGILSGVDATHALLLRKDGTWKLVDVERTETELLFKQVFMWDVGDLLYVQEDGN